jgi:sugar lactone lactonase YvrE
MKTLTAEPLFKVKNDLGEGPLWHPTEHRLYWVDIINYDLYRTDYDLTGFTTTRFNTPVGAFGFCAEGGMILATGDGFSLWDPSQPEPDIIWNPLPDRESVRLNDGKVDPAGRFWAGSMDPSHSEGEFYRLDPDGSQHTLLHNIGISNGLGWSPDRKTMYYTDSLQSTIFAFDYNLETGDITNQRPFVQLPKDNRGIVPDGLCVDADGCVWSAQWNGWQVIRYDPEGEPILSVNVPAQRVTSCCFGGEKDDQLFITSARADLSEEELAHQPHAGDVFVCQTDTQGQGTNFFGQSKG